MVSKVFSGSKIIAAAKGGQMLTTNQSGKEAYDAIIDKYGKILVSKKYYHRGLGNWTLYNPIRDANRATKIDNRIIVSGKGTKKLMEDYAKSGTQHMHDSNKKTKVIVRTGSGVGETRTGYV